MKQIFSVITILSLLTMIFSCSEEKNYEDAIPAECMALVRIPVMNDGTSAARTVLDIFAGNGLFADEAIDTLASLYLFETPDGAISLCAKVKSASAIDDALESMQKEGKASEVKERKEVKYSLVNHNFLIAYNDDAMLCTGPVLPSSLQQQLSRLSRYLEMNPDRSAGNGDMFKVLAEDGSCVSLMAKVSALPKQFVAPFLLGVPTGISSSDVYLHSFVQCIDSTMILKGSTSSDNVLASQGIERAKSMFRSFMADEMDEEKSIVTLYANVKGTDFISLLETNKDLSQTLSSKSFREKLSAIDGNMALTISPRVMGATVNNADAATTSYDVDVIPLPEAENSSIRMRVIIDLQRAGDGILATLAPFLKGIKKIEYVVE